MSTIDLEAIRRNALALTNGVEEVMPMGEGLEVTLADDQGRAPVYAAVFIMAGPTMIALCDLVEQQAGELATVIRERDDARRALDKVLAAFNGELP